MAKACVKMGKWRVSVCADIHCLWFMRKALPLASGTPVGNKAKSSSPAGIFCAYTRKSTQTSCFLTSGPEWIYSLKSHQQAGNAHYDFSVRRTPTEHVCIGERRYLMLCFCLVAALSQAFFPLWDLKRERWYKDMLSRWMKSLISCLGTKVYSQERLLISRIGWKQWLTKIFFCQFI